MHIKYYITLILYIIGSLNYVAAKGRDRITEVTDTFQLGRCVVEISLPKESVIALGRGPIFEGVRAGVILLDSLNIMNEALHIYIEDISMASCSGIGYNPDDKTELIEVMKLPNAFTVNLFNTPDGYLIEALSYKYGLAFTHRKAKTAADAKSMMPVFKSIRILPMTEYDNTKSSRRKMKAKLRVK